jgi:hypothetical protein
VSYRHSLFSAIISFCGGSVLISALITISSDTSRKFIARRGMQRRSAQPQGSAGAELSGWPSRSEKEGCALLIFVFFPNLVRACGCTRGKLFGWHNDYYSTGRMNSIL